MSKPKEIAKKGLNIVAGAGIIGMMGGFFGVVGSELLTHNTGMEISEVFSNNMLHLTSIGLLTAATARGLRRIFVDGPNTKMDGSPKSA